MPKITLYYKPHCGWCQGVLALLKRYQLEFETVDLSVQPEGFTQMVFESGQTLAPSVRIDDVWLVDLSAEDFERYLIIHGIGKPNGVCHDADMPQSAEALARRAQRRDTIRFF